MSSSTLRSLGLCEDHFAPTSFTNATKLRLKRDAVPIPYNNTGSSTSNENVELQEVQSTTDNTAAFAPNNENMILEKQVPQQTALRTYRSGNLNFKVSVEEEDVMEWVHLEPPIHENIQLRYDSTQRNSEDNNSKAVIKALRIENLILRTKLRRLKYRL